MTFAADLATRTDVVGRAFVFAYAAHAAVKQKRKYSEECYVWHPVAVAEIVSGVPHTLDMLAAALLHDVVEDTGVTFAVVCELFGLKIMNLVEQLTDVSKLSDGNRAARKHNDLLHTAKVSAEAQTIKLADLLHNAQSILENDPGFAVTFMREKQALLAVLTKGDPQLLARARAMVADYYATHPGA